MACHAKAARLWIFHESSHLIVSDLFIFSIQCFSAHSISLCVDTPCTNPTHAPPPHHYRRLPLMPPSPHHPPHFHKWCSDVHQTQQWRITISCRSLSTKALYHFVPPPPAHQHTPALPCWVLWCEGADEFLSRHFRGPHREPATCCQCKWIPKLAKIRKEVHCSTGRAELESACLSEWTTRYFGRIENKARTWPQRCSRAHGGSKRPPCPSFQRRRKKWREPG